MGKSVEFKNKEAVLTAFENADGVTAWAILAEKMLKFKGITRDELESFLELVEENGDTSAVYTLCLFEGIKTKDQIKSTTPYDYSFNFKLNVEKNEDRRIEYREHSKSRITALEEKFDRVIGMLEGEEEVEKPKNNLGVIGDIINHPSIAPIIPLLIKNFVGKIMGVNIPTQQQLPIHQAAVIAGVNDDTKITQAITKLKVYDPNLADHLLKLAEIAEHNTPVFNMLIQSLDQS